MGLRTGAVSVRRVTGSETQTEGGWWGPVETVNGGRTQNLRERDDRRSESEICTHLLYVVFVFREGVKERGRTKKKGKWWFERFTQEI